MLHLDQALDFINQASVDPVIRWAFLFAVVMFVEGVVLWIAEYIKPTFRRTTLGLISLGLIGIGVLAMIVTVLFADTKIVFPVSTPFIGGGILVGYLAAQKVQQKSLGAVLLTLLILDALCFAGIGVFTSR